MSSLNKSSGIACVHLTPDMKCDIFNQPERPAACLSFQPESDFCGNNRSEALQILTQLESVTR
nr:Fe-S-cluster oxidoreductase [uncultured Neptuniibacter sp.]